MSTEVLTGYAPYDSYKESGIDWLGEIPTEWDLLKVKNIFRLANKFSEKNNSHELLSVYTDIGVKPRKELEERGNKASTTDGYLIVGKGDIVVNKLLAWMGAIGYSNYDGVTSPAYDILKPKIPVSSVFYHFLFRTPRCISELKRNSRGIMDMRLRLYFDKFGNILVPLPSLKEQEKIVKFLKNKIDQIDQAINLKQQQIEKLNEYKQITIQNAVTKGLDTNAKMKDSGIDWIGDIPEHWEIKKTTHLFGSIGSGSTPSSSNPIYYDGNINWLQTGDLNDRVINSTSKKITEKALRDYGILKLYPSNSLVIALYGATIGKIGLLNIETTTNQACCVLSELNNNEIKYFYYFFLCAKKSLIQLSKGGGQPNISQNTIRNLRLTLPPKNEQISILDYLDIKCNKIFSLTDKYEAQIERLKEYKTILINQAVTGKIKVS